MIPYQSAKKGTVYATGKKNSDLVQPNEDEPDFNFATLQVVPVVLCWFVA